MTDYKIKFGKLKGFTPEEAYNKGEIEELIKLRTSLITNFKNPSYKNYKKANLEGYLAIEEVLLRNYQPLLKEFNTLFENLSEKDKQIFGEKIDFDIFYQNDIIKLNEVITNLKEETV